ncbi:MAG TPA: choice-of-anchor Q domain-containing protein [Candidatus Binataceae bacterium]|nr:choice-of-anchor Q domain-containing protein [Candidatus Binataceae bacterium]
MKADTTVRGTIAPVLFALLLWATPCAAKGAKVQLLCVNPSSSACQPTIQDAVNKASRNAVISVAAGHYHENVTINGGAKPPKLTLAINGAGPGKTIVDADQNGHVFEAGANTTLTLSGMTIENGNTGTGAAAGGGVDFLGSALTISNCVIADNTADLGGGVFVNAGTVTIVSSTLSDNLASSDLDLPFSVENSGGGLYSSGATKQTTITNSTIADNNASLGGGAAISSRKLLIQNSAIIDNAANPVLPPGGVGGISRNALGGGLYIGKTTATILNSTISDNSVTDNGEPTKLTSFGGGIQNSGGKITINNVTIADNSADGGGGVRTVSGKSFVANNSIIAEDSSDDCEGIVTSAFSLILDPSGCTIKGSTITGKDPLLQSLALNPPGSTKTQALSNGSPALKAGNPAKPTGKGKACMPTDQRGIKRPQKACDLGAYQLSS